MNLRTSQYLQISGNIATMLTIHKRSRYTIGGAGHAAGIFWSGAMRCPKCRADMEQINYEGTEIDRCTICRGIWYETGSSCHGSYLDAGELRDLSATTISDFFKSLATLERK